MRRDSRQRLPKLCIVGLSCVQDSACTKRKCNILMAPPSKRSRQSPAARASKETDVKRLVNRYRSATSDELRAVLEKRTVLPYPLMRYHLGWEDRHGRSVKARGGKLLRPTLCLLSCDAVGGDWRRAAPAAAALELLHNFTLIHDDVEDASLHRHGRETLWTLWGEAQAINVGDGMFVLSHVTLLRLREQGFSPEQVLQAVHMLDQATLRLCEGQHRDLVYADEREIDLRDYLAMIEGKTAVLLAASSGIGALLGGGPGKVVQALSDFGRHLGLAFQIRDDVLGIWGDTDETGKPTGDDLRAGKKSYPVVVAFERGSAQDREALASLLADGDLSDAAVRRAYKLLERLDARQESERAAQQHVEAALACLAGLTLRPQRLQELEQLAHFAAQRHS